MFYISCSFEGFKKGSEPGMPPLTLTRYGTISNFELIQNKCFVISRDSELYEMYDRSLYKDSVFHNAYIALKLYMDYDVLKFYLLFLDYPSNILSNSEIKSSLLVSFISIIEPA